MSLPQISYCQNIDRHLLQSHLRDSKKLLYHGFRGKVTLNTNYLLNHWLLESTNWGCAFETCLYVEKGWHNTVQVPYHISTEHHYELLGKRLDMVHHHCDQ